MSQIEVSDEDLVARFLFGCSDSFDQIMSRYETKVFNTALYLTSDTDDAESVLHKVFTALYHRLNDDFGKTPLFEWLLQYTLDTAVACLIERKSETEESAESEELKLTSPYDEHAEHFQEKNTALRNAIRETACSLPGEYKALFLLRDIQGLKTSEVARLLDSNVFEVRAKLHEARLIIRDRLLDVLGESSLQEYIKDKKIPMVEDTTVHEHGNL